MFNLASHPRPPRCTGAELDRRLRQVKEQLWAGRTRSQVVHWAMNKLRVSRRTAQLYVRQARLLRLQLDTVAMTLAFLRDAMNLERRYTDQANCSRKEAP